MNMNHIHPYPVHTNGFHKSFSEHTLKTSITANDGEELSKSSNRSNPSNHSNGGKLNGKEANSINMGLHPHSVHSVHKTINTKLSKKQLRFIGIDDLDKRRSASAVLESMIEKLSR